MVNKKHAIWLVFSGLLKTSQVGVRIDRWMADFTYNDISESLIGLILQLSLSDTF